MTNNSLSNTALYNGCTINTVAGRATLVTPPVEAMNIIGQNLESMLAGNDDRSVCTLTGPMAVWTYLSVFRAVCNKFSRVDYDDGRGVVITVAAK